MKMTMAVPYHGEMTQRCATAIMCMLPVLALSSSLGLSLVQLLVLVGCFGVAPLAIWRWYGAHAAPARWVMLGFAGYFLVSLGRMVYFEQAARTLDGPLRLLLALTCIGFVGYFKPRIHWFWIGLCVAAIGTGAIALVQRLALGMERADGFTHHSITFGDLSLALGLMALCALSQLRQTRLAWLPAAGVVCGLLASLLSGSRGGWAALPLVAVPLLYYGHAIHGRRLMIGLGLVAALLALAYCVPASGVAGRAALAASDVQRYVALGDATTSVGIRLELWKASWIMFSEHPWLGVGRDAFHPALEQLARQGRLLPSPALGFSSSHNDLLHMLATGGLIDASCLMLMYFGPLGFFCAILSTPPSPRHAPALAGVVLVVAFVGFGLTDVMFWLMATKLFYGIMVCTLTGFCLAVPASLPSTKARS